MSQILLYNFQNACSLVVREEYKEKAHLMLKVHTGNKISIYCLLLRCQAGDLPNRKRREKKLLKAAVL